MRAQQVCSESQARNFSDSHDEHDVVGIKIIIHSGIWLAQRRDLKWHADINIAGNSQK